MPGVTHPEAGGQGDVLPTLGGASRAPGLPQAAARSLFGRGPHPLCTGAAGVLRHETGRQEKAAVVGVWALCAGFRAKVGAAPLSGILGQRWAACGAAAVRAIRIQRKNASGKPRFGPSGGVRF